MNNEQKRRELDRLHKRYTAKLIGIIPRILTLKADLLSLELQRDQTTIDLVAVIRQQKEMSDE